MRSLVMICGFSLIVLVACGGGGINHFIPTGGDGGSDGGKAETCEDGRVDGKETDIDCGGPDCAACGSARLCLHPADCVSGGCYNNRCVDVGGHCVDHQKNADETDVDCGGPTCSTCALGRACSQSRDCSSNQCDGSRCVNPSHVDGGDDLYDGGTDGSHIDLGHDGFGGDGATDGFNTDGGVDLAHFG